MFKAKNHRFGFFIGDMMYHFLSQALLIDVTRLRTLGVLGHPRALEKLSDDKERGTGSKIGGV